MLILSFIVALVAVLMGLFFIFSKESSWQAICKSVFECGFTSYFMSRFSFPVHYFIVALTFLILDLELVLLFPFFMEWVENFSASGFLYLFAFSLTLALLIEWKMGLLDWKN